MPADQLSASPPLAGAGDEAGVTDLVLRCCLWPGRMPDAKEAFLFTMLSESRVALEKELGQRFRFAGLESFAARFAFVNQMVVMGVPHPKQGVGLRCVPIRKFPDTVRQTEAARSEKNGGQVVQPFGQEKNSRLAA